MVCYCFGVECRESINGGGASVGEGAKEELESLCVRDN